MTTESTTGSSSGSGSAEVVSDGRAKEAGPPGAALFVDGVFTHAVLLNAASVRRGRRRCKGAPLNDAAVGGLCSRLRPGFVTCLYRQKKPPCCLPGFVLLNRGH